MRKSIFVAMMVVMTLAAHCYGVGFNTRWPNTNPDKVIKMPITRDVLGYDCDSKYKLVPFEGKAYTPVARVAAKYDGTVCGQAMEKVHFTDLEGLFVAFVCYNEDGSVACAMLYEAIEKEKK